MLLLHAVGAGSRSGARHAERAAEVRGRYRGRRQAARRADAQGEAGRRGRPSGRRRRRPASRCAGSLQVARGAGLRVSAAEGIDAARAARSRRLCRPDGAEGHAGRSCWQRRRKKRALTTKCSNCSSSATNSPAGSTPKPNRRGEDRDAARPRRRRRRRRAWAAAAASRLGQLLESDDRAALATGDGTGRPRSRHREHPLLHPDESLRPPHPRPHGPARRWNATSRRCARPARPRPRTRASSSTAASRPCAIRCAISSNATCCCSPAAKPKNSARNC